MGYEVDFLPVGEGEKSGDAILLRFGDLNGSRSDQSVVLVDGGFKTTAPGILKHIEDYYKTDLLDLVVSTHPDADHINGLLEVLEELQVNELWMHRPSIRRAEIERALRSAENHEYRKAVRASLDAASELEDLAVSNGVVVQEPFAGVVHSSGLFSVLGPTEEFYLQLFREEPEVEGKSLLRVLATASA
ncbi:MAG: MBL fold metallo-hydrolase, partial [Rhodothermia bacterium]|nr:MBL fold metallo-hydrolase [Rhodothermia bacterium]